MELEKIQNGPCTPGIADHDKIIDIRSLFPTLEKIHLLGDNIVWRLSLLSWLFFLCYGFCVCIVLVGLFCSIDVSQLQTISSFTIIIILFP